MKLINANKLRKDVLDLPNCPDGYSDTYDKALIIALIDDQPTIDVDNLNAKHEDIGYERGRRDGYAEALEVTDNAEPVRHGHIVYRERYRIKYGKYTGVDENGEEHTITVCEDYGSGKEPYCSECGSQLAESSVNYCPRCGAKMDEVTENAKTN